ncbi:transporter substrate-binding domain-containing protein [Thalassotalea sp. G2M2-11]|uniref:substrate-binding periplasmic protein n=1 Tax=Thalassotalea sp. G2M2-11 TaxID=2787627 RepID=UPI0019D1200C|nr:transporter substrate-binding domain-containing protein [Thalassotalea sp. G2M2-11]
MVVVSVNCSNLAWSANKTQVSDTETLRLKYEPSGSNSWFPYYIKSEQRQGILPELIPLVLQRADIEGQEVALPAARTNLALASGEIDFDFINPEWLPATTPLETFIFSVPIMPIKEYFIALKDSDIETLPEKMKQSSDIRIGTVHGYYYHDDDLFTRVDFSSEKNLIRALKHGRIKYAICGEVTAKYWSKILDVPIVVGAIHSDGYLHFRFRKELAEVVPRINQAITELKQAGLIDKIVSSYL